MEVLEMCHHRGCRCDAREDGFCSDHCAEHAGQAAAPAGQGATAAHACECGHDDCETGPAAECVWG